MAKIKIDEFGAKHYFNDQERFHREDGPAYIRPTGILIWYKNGKAHREHDPATFNHCGLYGWRAFGNLHRSNGPSWDFPNGHKQWYQDDKKIWPQLK